MPYSIHDTGKSGPHRYAIIKKATGKVVAHAGSQKDADIYVGKAEGADKHCDSLPGRLASGANASDVKEFGDTPTPKLAHVDGVELFDVGTHKGKTYGPDHIDTLVDNFNKLSTGDHAKLSVPVVIGHEEDQPLMDNTGIPAAGRLARVYREGTKLKGDFVDVPEPIAKLINQRAYRKVSAEIYDNFQDQGQPYGVALRRIALLGGEVPQVKSLADIPLAQFSERLARLPRRPSRLIVSGVRRSLLQTTIFSEVKPMDRAQMLAALKQIGFNTDLLTDAVPDEVIAELLAALQTGAQGGGPGSGKLSPADQNAPPANSQLSDDPTVGSSAQPTYQANGDTSDPADQTAGGVTPSPFNSVGSKAQPTKVTIQYASEMKKFSEDITKVVTDLRTQVQTLSKQTAQRLQNEKKANIDAFCERMVKSGKLLPSQLDRGDPKNPKATIKDVLLAADANPVHKFGERSISQLDLLMQAIENGPTVARFAELVRDPAGSPGDVSDERRQRLLALTPNGKAAAARNSKK